MPDLERIPSGEAAQIQNVVDLTVAQMKRRYPDAAVLRGVHPKDHGCVSARFRVHDSLPAELRVGVFAVPGREYKAVIRYSNASVLVAPDAIGSRGMAVKLYGVEGSPLLDTSDPGTQDFLMVNHPVFAIANVEDYEALSRILLEDKDDPTRFFAERIRKGADGSPDFSDPATVRAVATFTIAKRLQATTCPPAFQPPPASPVDNRYFSGSPFAFGDGKAMKFSAVPAGATATAPEVSDPNYLRAALRARLSAAGAADVVFDFQIQVRDAAELADKIDSDIENACFEWDETKHPFVSVATITIPAQDFDTAQERTQCESLRYSPWHGVTEHRPLGGINRLRLGVYRASADFRHLPRGGSSSGPDPLERTDVQQ
jgi:hypothetical protein